MFPTPIQKRPVANQIAYKTFLPIALILWLLPLIAVAVFSIKPAVDFTQGNYWGWSESGLQGFANYWMVFTESDMPRYLWNSVVITIRVLSSIRFASRSMISVVTAVSIS